MRVFLVLAAFALISCGDAQGTDRSDSENAPGRGSKACKEWQDAICDYAADRCGLSSRDNCDQQYRGATCRSDAQAQRCAKLLDEAACGLPPEDCVLAAVADPAPAIQACEELLDALCDHFVMCGVSVSASACRADPSVTAIDCSRAIAYGLAHDQCIQDVDAWTCDMSKPSSCDKVIVAH